MARGKSTGLLRAAARVPTTGLTEAEQALSDDAVAAFVEACGGRRALSETLAVAAPSNDLDPFVRLLLDPRYDQQPIPRLCRLAGLTVADCFVAYRKAVVAKAHIAAAVAVAEKIPAVIADVLTRAAPHTITCPTCGGEGSLPPRPTRANPNPAPQPCATCRATGQVFVLPDLDRQKLALELAQLTQKGGGIFVQQTNTAVSGDARAPLQVPGALEQLQQAVSQILYQEPITLAPETPETIDATPAPVDEPAVPPDPDAPDPDLDDEDDADDDEDDHAVIEGEPIGAPFTDPERPDAHPRLDEA